MWASSLCTIWNNNNKVRGFTNFTKIKNFHKQIFVILLDLFSSFDVYWIQNKQTDKLKVYIYKRLYTNSTIQLSIYPAICAEPDKTCQQGMELSLSRTHLDVSTCICRSLTFCHTPPTPIYPFSFTFVLSFVVTFSPRRKLKFYNPLSLQPDRINLWYFKLWSNFDVTELIISGWKDVWFENI